MTIAWTDFYLICFLAGVVFTLISVFGGSLHMPHFHLHLGGHGAHAGHGGHGGGVVNGGTIAAFLVWFGGTGYLLVRYYDFRLLLALILAIVAGIAGASMVFLFLARVLMRGGDDAMDPADYDMIGVLAKVSSGIRPDGTGELIFSQEGSRRSAPARSATGASIAQGTEVVVIRYEGGVAYVQPWSELSNEMLAKKESL